MSAEYRPWFEKYPNRFKDETQILNESGFRLNEQIFEEEGRVQFEGSHPNYPSRNLTIRFPGAFPSIPPTVSDTSDSLLLSRHHAPHTRQLCLFGVRHSRWTAALSSQDVLNETQDLIQRFGIENSASQDDVVPEPMSATLPYGPDEYIFVPPPIAALEIPQGQRQSGEVSFRYAIESKCFKYGRGVVVSAKLGGRVLKAQPEYEGILAHNSQIFSATLLFPQTPSTVEALLAYVLDQIGDQKFSKKRATRWFALVFQEQSGSIAGVRIAWVFARVDSNNNVQWIRAFPYRPEERMARIPALQGIQNNCIAFIGCGCLGSKIAVNLAASGIQAFALTDSDYMEPYNSVRHEVGIPSFGLAKPEALFRRLRNVNPEVRANLLRFEVGTPAPVDIERQFHEVLSGASLIVDTTGSHGVSRWVNDLALDLGVPAVFASVTNGAWGGEVVRTIPNQTACWMCWNEQYSNSPPPSEPTGAIFAPGCNQPSFTGTTYDAAIVASLASSIIVDTLMTTSPKGRSYKGDYIRWSARNESGPLLKAEILSINRRPDCRFCSNQ